MNGLLAKRVYSTPVLTTYGTVEELTMATNPNPPGAKVPSPGDGALQQSPNCKPGVDCVSGTG